MVKMDGTVAPLQSDSPEPLWQQAAKAITREINAGKLTSGSRLPPERDLIDRLSISRVTLRRALQSLVGSGVLVSSHGRGWYVATEAHQEFPQTLESFSETAARLGLKASSEVLRAEEASATLDQAEELSIAPGSRLFHLDRIRKLDGVPVAIDTSYFPAAKELNLSGADFSTASLFRLMTEAGIELSRAESTIEAQAADPLTAKHLGIDAGMPILTMYQLIEDSAGKPLISSTIRYAGDRYRLRTSFSRTIKPGN
ncbi:GntR family transcriptional regulator [Rhizobium sp. P38BS-XIX]|uniref:GntR family transcriptional regulator n=1 Tax=Rhizobium sp. P38BS-XIX TaxID=2726740 RepID=UPI0014568A0D|nr:GntR family transcriptional regulator [Rhizobium sp. P38BS-XIX]NLR97682.1 GntR family transcriptional regulator [Rhizobium sp. P38BS-XIX]